MITKENLASCRAYYADDAVRQAMTHVLAKTPLAELAFVGEEAKKMQFQFSLDIPTMKSTNQKASGRCWLFAATNVLREIVAKRLHIEQFELSQSYMAFWDKFERCNAYLSAICETAKKPHDDRLVDYLTANGISDGGQWDMFVNLVEKYGVVPKSAFPETAQSGGTAVMNRQINTYLRANTAALRTLAAHGENTAPLKEEILQKIFSFLCACYGMPPETFDFEYADKDGGVHTKRNLTPLSFRDEYIGDVLRDTISLIHDPTSDRPLRRTYTVDYLNNVEGGAREILHYNLPMEEIKAAVLRQLRDGEIVWFGSDCGKFCNRDERAWDDASYAEDAITGFDTEMTKEDMLFYHVSQMNHAMCITGVNLDENGVPNRWKIQNSWGSEGVHDGYYMASDSWFDKYVFQAVVHRKYLPDADLTQPPIHLDPWDPMGSLAD